MRVQEDPDPSTAAEPSPETQSGTGQADQSRTGQEDRLASPTPKPSPGHPRVSVSSPRPLLQPQTTPGVTTPGGSKGVSNKSQGVQCYAPLCISRGAQTEKSLSLEAATGAASLEGSLSTTPRRRPQPAAGTSGSDRARNPGNTSGSAASAAHASLAQEQIFEEASSGGAGLDPPERDSNALLGRPRALGDLRGSSSRALRESGSFTGFTPGSSRRDLRILGGANRGGQPEHVSAAAGAETPRSAPASEYKLSEDGGPVRYGEGLDFLSAWEGSDNGDAGHPPGASPSGIQGSELAPRDPLDPSERPQPSAVTTPWQAARRLSEGLGETEAAGQQTKQSIPGGISRKAVRGTAGPYSGNPSGPPGGSLAGPRPEKQPRNRSLRPAAGDANPTSSESKPKRTSGTALEAVPGSGSRNRGPGQRGSRTGPVAAATSGPAIGAAAAAGGTADPSPLTAPQLLRLIEDVYLAKSTADVAAAREGRQPPALPEFVRTFMGAQHGIFGRAVAGAEQLRRFAASVRAHAALDAVALFGLSSGVVNESQLAELGLGVGSRTGFGLTEGGAEKRRKRAGLKEKPAESEKTDKRMEQSQVIACSQLFLVFGWCLV